MYKFFSILNVSFILLLVSCGKDKGSAVSAAEFESKAACILGGVDKKDCHYFFGHNFSENLDEEISLLETNIGYLENQIKANKLRINDLTNIRNLSEDQIIELEELEKEVPILGLEIKGIELKISKSEERLEFFRRFIELSLEQKKELKEINELISSNKILISKLNDSILKKEIRIQELRKLESLTDAEIIEYKSKKIDIQVKENKRDYYKGRLAVLFL